MPFVAIDTNCVMRDYLLIEANMQSFLRGCQQCHIHVFLPEVVLDEAVGNYHREVKKAAAEHKSAALKLQKIGVKAQVADIDVAAEVEKYRKHIYTMMRIYDVELVPYPATTAKAIVEASYAGKKPFKESGDGFKDFLIFENLKTLAGRGLGDGWFVTSNNKDFCGQDGKLHPDLSQALPSSNAITIVENIHAFNTTILSQHQVMLDDIAKRITDGAFEGFDLKDKLTDLFIKQLYDKYYPIDNSGTPLDEPTVQSVDTPHTTSLKVSRLGQDELLLELEGTVSLELWGFIEKGQWYSMSDDEDSTITVDDSDWNDWVISAYATREYKFSMTVIYDEKKKLPSEVSIELEPDE